MLLIIDNQNAFIKKFRDHYLDKQNFDYIFFDHNQAIEIPAGAPVKGIILSGGRGNPYKPLNLTANFVALMNFDVPLLGFCLGHEIIAVAHGGGIKRLPEYHGKKELIKIKKADDPIFSGLDRKEVSLVKRHYYHVSDLPESFESLAASDTCKNEIIKHKQKPIYGFQGHPEVSGKDGLKIVENFLKICKILN